MQVLWECEFGVPMKLQRVRHLYGLLWNMKYLIKVAIHM